MKHNRIKYVPIVVAAFLLIGIGIALYFSIKYFNSTFTPSSSVLADLASLNGYFLSIASLIILGGISYFGFIVTSRYNDLLIKPILFVNNIFKNNNISFPERSYQVWVLGNASNHPAINLLIRHNITKPCEQGPNQIGTTKWVSCSSLAGKQSIELFWINYASDIEICYTDATESNYYLSTISNLRVNTESISKDYFLNCIDEADNNRNNNIINLMDKGRYNNFDSHNIETYVSYLKRIELLITDYEPNYDFKDKPLPQIFPQTTAPPRTTEA